MRGFERFLRGFQRFLRGFQRFLRGFQRSSQRPSERQISSERLSVFLPLIVLPLELSPNHRPSCRPTISQMSTLGCRAQKLHAWLLLFFFMFANGWMFRIWASDVPGSGSAHALLDGHEIHPFHKSGVEKLTRSSFERVFLNTTNQVELMSKNRAQMGLGGGVRRVSGPK